MIRKKKRVHESDHLTADQQLGVGAARENLGDGTVGVLELEKGVLGEEREKGIPGAHPWAQLQAQ